MANLSLYDLQRAFKLVPGYGTNKVLTLDSSGNPLFVDKKAFVESQTPTVSLSKDCFTGTGTTTDPFRVKM